MTTIPQFAQHRTHAPGDRKLSTDVLIVGSENLCQQLLTLFSRERQYRVERAVSHDAIRRYLGKHAGAICIIFSVPENTENSLDTLQFVRKTYPAVPRLFLVIKSTEELAISALRQGATDYLVWPVADEELIAAVQRHCPTAVARETDASSRLVGRSGVMRDAVARLKRLAATDCPVLITGETGTGKELAAQLLHSESVRSSHPMVSLNCAAIPDNLLESELFGHERGAFTGAHTSRPGALADAHRGTVLLDEIGDMDLISQAKILRAVETRSIQRLGSSRPIPVDVRLVAATHCDLSERVAQGRFRQDLFYRLQVARVHMPALRDRAEDIGFLTQHYLQQLRTKYGGRTCTLRADLRGMFQAHDWPGNVRELRNLLEAMYVFSSGTELTPADLPAEYKGLANGKEPAGERERLLYVLRSTDWNKAEAARKLHCSRMTLYRKMAKYELLKEGSSGLSVLATSA